MVLQLRNHERFQMTEYFAKSCSRCTIKLNYIGTIIASYKKELCIEDRSQ